MGDPGSTDNPRMAPPTMPGDLVPVRPSWPTVIGVLAVVFGGFWAITTCGKIAGLPFGARIDIRQYAFWDGVLMLLSIPLALWHLMAGIGTICRRHWGTWCLLLWAVANCIYVVLDFARSQWTAGPIGGFWMTVASLIMPVIVLIILLGWPIFLLVYLTRPRTRSHWRTWT